MPYSSIIDSSPFAPVVSICAVLLQTESLIDAAGWLQFANNLTVPAVLLLGLYFLYKMNAETEVKREQNNKDLVEKLDKAHKETVEFLTVQLRETEQERKNLQDKIIDKTK